MPKAKTQELDISGAGVSPVKIKSIESAANAYITIRDERCLMTPNEIAAKKKLVDAIHEHAEKIGKNPEGAIVYRYDDLVITLKPGKEKVSVKSASDDDDGDDD